MSGSSPKCYENKVKQNKGTERQECYFRQGWRGMPEDVISEQNPE